MDVVCEREAKIREILNKETIFNILKILSRTTRTKSGDLGPIGFGEIQEAFVAAVGQAPTNETVQMLQRLPGLGRIDSDSDERQFIDTFVLDGLRASDVASIVENGEQGVLRDVWTNALGTLGQRILSRKIDGGTFQKYRGFVSQSSHSKNRILGGDIVSAALRLEVPLEFNDTELAETMIGQLSITCPKISGLTISDSLIEDLTVSSKAPGDFKLVKCQIGKAYGITDAKSVPAWIVDSQIAQYESAENVSRIKKIQLDAKHQILVTILKKLFLQKGSGRQEEALMRGLGQIDRSSYTAEIIKILKRERLITTGRGDHGVLYIPDRSHTGRVKAIIGELGTSKDPIWLEVSALH
jgi:hypothetical protein